MVDLAGMQDARCAERAETIFVSENCKIVLIVGGRVTASHGMSMDIEAWLHDLVVLVPCVSIIIGTTNTEVSPKHREWCGMVGVFLVDIEKICWDPDPADFPLNRIVESFEFGVLPRMSGWVLEGGKAVACVKLTSDHKGCGHGWRLHAVSHILWGLQAAKARCASLWFGPVGCDIGFFDSVETGGKVVVFVRL